MPDARDDMRAIDATLAMARSQALAFVKEVANSDTRHADEARRILRRHAPHLSPIIERYADTRQRRREKEQKDDRES